MNIDDREWELFKDTWQRYKPMTGLTTVDGICMEIWASCSLDVNKVLFEFIGAASLDAASEQDLLRYICNIAVKETLKEVHCMNFGKMIQMEGESITQFAACLKSQASLCQFTITCPSHTPPTAISYADQLVTQQLIVGLRNHEHQSKILAKSTTLLTLQTKIERLQCLEATEESTLQMRMTLLTTTATATRQPQYQLDKKAGVADDLHTQGSPCHGETVQPSAKSVDLVVSRAILEQFAKEANLATISHWQMQRRRKPTKHPSPHRKMHLHSPLLPRIFGEAPNPTGPG